jgi:5-methylcytosine-specific restriction endonuclease McrA
MPCNYKEYPDNWKWLSAQIIKDAGNKCELCYAPNGVTVNRSKSSQYPWEMAHQDGGKETVIVLTVHHIDSNKQNSKKQNLIALCQRCHLRLDLQKHMKNRKLKRTSAGENTLLF